MSQASPRGRLRKAGFRLLATAAVGLAASMAQADDRPNIVLIVDDDLGYAGLGAFGGEIETPNLDALAKDGVKLTSFYAAPTCSQTKSMLMSGTDNHLAGVGNMVELMAEEQRGQSGSEGFLSDRMVAFPQLLQDAGYDTYMAGKWHLGGKAELLPANRGFDKSTVLIAGAASHYDQTGANVQVPVASYRKGTEPFTLPQGFYSTDFYTDTMLDLAGVAAPGTQYHGHAVEPIKGKSLLPALTEAAETVRGPGDSLGWELSGRIAVRQGDWKLVWSNKLSGTGDWQIFDVAKDPAEAQDVAAANPEKRAELVARWESYRGANGVA